jgi:hypothetical protein
VLIGLLFNSFLLIGSVIAIFFGGSLERKFIGFLLFCSLSTVVFNAAFGRDAARFAITSLDIAILVAAVSIALRHNRYWPLWFAGFHSITVLSDLVLPLFPSEYSAYFIAFSGFWALPAMLVMAAGIIQDHRAGIGCN